MCQGELERRFMRILLSFISLVMWGNGENVVEDPPYYSQAVLDVLMPGRLQGDRLPEIGSYFYLIPARLR